MSSISDVDRQRARELYKYFQPDDPALLSSIRHSPSEAAFRLDGDRKLSPNITLTAYAQLIAIRLNAQRALISLVGEDDLYDVAEATKTLDISNTESYSQQGDELWVGCQRVPKTGRLCAYTVALPPNTINPNFFIVNDLTKDERFINLPYVCRAPHFKFYAGTPITTKSGINIGSLFILDDKPRDGLTDEEKKFLSSMASVCINFLEIVRDAAEGRKIERMSRGLHAFVEGKMSFVAGKQNAIDSAAQSSSTTPPTASGTTGVSASSETTETPSAPEDEPNHLRRNTSRHELSEAEKNTLSSLTDTLGEQAKSRIEILAESESLEREWTLARAANLVREAMDLDEDGGVVIFDVRNMPVKFFEHKLNGGDYFDSDREGAPDSPAEFPAPTRISSTLEFESSADAGQGDSQVLASSCTAEPLSVGDNSTELGGSRFKPMPARFMNRFLFKYPNGQIWDFDDSDDSIPTVLQGSKSIVKEHEFLKRFFPGVRHLMFVPMWEATSSQWCSGMFAWNTKSTRAFSAEVELTFCMSFGKSVMAELSRIETIKADRLKGDFIGSISHELRSPLHGVLASLDFLTETKFDSFQESLINTIEACGRTLLDTINHVLNYSKVNSVERNWRRGKRSNRSLSKVMASDPSLDTPLLNQYSYTNVAAMLEEVVEGVVAGYSYKDIGSQDITTSTPLSPPPERMSSNRQMIENNAPQTLGSKGIEIMLDIEPGNWMFMTQPGALRRCFMNVFGNAVKYTDKGSILVRLEAGTLPPDADKDTGKMLRFIVTDTGRGISADFLRSKIFTPFAQEDHLSPGTGLGLSIVRSITTMLGGSIDVKSQLGRGTTVTIEVPLMRQTESDIAASKGRPPEHGGHDMIDLLKRESENRTYVIYDYDPNIENPKSPINYLGNFMKDWFGLNLLAWNPDKIEADIVLARNDRLPQLRGMLKASRDQRRGLILVSTTVNYNLASYSSPGSDLEIQYTSKPCGPYKLAKVLYNCVSRLNNPVVEGLSFPSPEKEEPPQQVDIGSQDVIPVLTEAEEIINTLPSLSKVASGDYLEMKIRPSPKPVVVRTKDALYKKPTVTFQEVSPIESSKDTSSVSSPTSTETKVNSLKREPRVLLVEDNKINLRLLQTFVKKRKYTCVDSAEHGGLAIEAVEKAEVPYDVIFMDISMPIMNGFEATQAIREFESKASRNGAAPAPRSTIIALTGLASARDQNEAFAAGVDLFITKPVSFKEVGRLLDQWETNLAAAEAAAP